jgi:hypothetical protein
MRIFPPLATVGLYYDYERQTWVRHGVVQPCGHPGWMHPGCCYAGKHAGERVELTGLPAGRSTTHGFWAEEEGGAS